MEVEARLRRALLRPAGESSDFDLNPAIHLPPGRKLRPAAVLVAVQGDGVILTKRSSHLKHHPGQIAFPGGKVDEGDASAEAAALREAQEEVGLPPEAVEILGRLPAHETVTGFTVTPILALVRQPFLPVPEAGEVDEVFVAPLAHLLDRSQYVIESRLWQSQRRRYYAVPWGPYYIWGATARILRGLAERVVE
ncbi:CoA pyrophosphatase [Rhodobacter sp. Har01]|uniref:CoA pyrophosphatase n=1 Tax=Rhodobacter sp. Har01 TaxID=2883999 RepID=UPI001D073528|nr:CoA pyrophosphatase [Rhodobacter sp. Har01]MCB6178016.1 CoA pyrophosphatase [Rhodobacter sp. Har01]